MSKLFVGNLSWSTTEDELQSLFESVGKVKSIRIVNDKNTGRSKGFGFVEYENADDAKRAIETLNDKDFNGRKLRVCPAQEPQDRPAGGGFGRGPSAGAGRDRDQRPRFPRGERSDYQGGRSSR